MEPAELRQLLADEADEHFEPLDPLRLLRTARSERRKRILLSTALGTVAVVAAAAAVVSSTNSDAGGRATIFPATTSPRPSATRPLVNGAAPTLHLSWPARPEDGAAATVTGAGFTPGAAVQIVPCQPDADCSNLPATTVQADGAGTFSVSVTAHLVIHDAYGDSFMCAQNCRFIAEDVGAKVSTETAPFDLVALPPAGEQCAVRDQQLSYLGPGSSTSANRSAVFRMRNTGTSTCWVFGSGEVGLDDQPPLPKVGWTVDQSPPGWPPRVVTLPPGGTAQFTVTKPACTGTSSPLTQILFGDRNHNGNVPLPAGAQAQLALCTNVAGAAPNLPAPENVLTVSAYTAG